MATPRQVERIAATIANGTSSQGVTLATTLLDTSKAFLVFGVRNAQNAPVNCRVTGTLTNTTTVTFQRVGTVGVVECVGYVCEFLDGIVVERGTVTDFDPNNPKVVALATITSLSTSFLLSSYRVTGNIYSNDDAYAQWLVDNGGTIEAHFQANQAPISGAHGIAWQAIQYDACIVQRPTPGAVTLASGAASTTATVSTVDLAKSLLLFTGRHDSGDAANIGQKLLRGRKTSATQLTFDRSVTGVAIDAIEFELVSFLDATTVQAVLSSFTATDGQNDETITSVDLTRACAVATWGQMGGRGSYTGDDIPGESYFTCDLTTGTNLQLIRASTIGTADVAVDVLEFGDPGQMLSATGRVSTTSYGIAHIRTELAPSGHAAPTLYGMVTLGGGAPPPPAGSRLPDALASDRHTPALASRRRLTVNATKRPGRYPATTHPKE